jgi:hypothetical protein
MKKIILFAFLTVFSVCAFAITPDSNSKSESPSVSDKKEIKMSEEETNNLTKRSEEMRNIDKMDQSIVVREGHRPRRGYHGDMNRDYRGSSSVVFVGGGAAVVIIILILILI